MAEEQLREAQRRARRALIKGMLQALVVAGGLGAVAVLVYLSGTNSIAVHLFYLPIIFAGYAFGDYGAMITSLLAAALTSHGMPARVLPDGTREPQGIWDPAVRAAMFFIIGLASSRASYEVRRRALEAQKLYEVAQSISSTLRLRQVLELIVRHAVEVMEATACSIRLYNPDTGELELVAMYGLSDEYWSKGPVRLEDSPVDQRAMSGEAVQVNDLQSDASFQYQAQALREGIRAVLTVPLRSKDEVLGVIRIYSNQRRRFTPREVRLLTAFANQAAVAIENAELYEDIRRNYYETVRALTTAIEARDRSTYSHSERVTQLTEALAEELGLSAEERELIRFGAILHDIGKIGLEEGALAPGGADAEVFYRMHPLIGASILQPISFLEPVLPMVAYHHERWDGSGFPEGLKAKDIPFYARLVAVADAYERLLNPLSPEQEPLEPDEAVRRIVELAGSAFDPEVVAAFERLMEKRPELKVPAQGTNVLRPPQSLLPTKAKSRQREGGEAP